MTCNSIVLAAGCRIMSAPGRGAAAIAVEVAFLVMGKLGPPSSTITPFAVTHIPHVVPQT